MRTGQKSSRSGKKRNEKKKKTHLTRAEKAGCKQNKVIVTGGVGGDKKKSKKGSGLREEGVQSLRRRERKKTKTRPIRSI